MRDRIIYWTAPRYTAGKAAPVEEARAFQIASLEAAGYREAISGRRGEEDRSRAHLMGLGGIVEMRVERHSGWDVVDMIEGKAFFRPKDLRPGRPGSGGIAR